MTRKLDRPPFFDFSGLTLKTGIIRVGVEHAAMVVFDNINLKRKTFPSWIMVAIAGIGHINYSNVTGISATIRVPGGTSETSKWVKFGQTRKGEKFGIHRMTLPIDKVEYRKK